MKETDKNMPDLTLFGGLGPQPDDQGEAEGGESCSLCNKVHKNQLCLAAQYGLANFYLAERNKAKMWTHVLLQVGRKLRNKEGMMGYLVTAVNPITSSKVGPFFVPED